MLAAASMLPDLWRMVERRARLGSRHFRVPDAHHLPTSAVRGLTHHLETDRWFHDDAFFTEGEALTVRAMQSAGVTSEKMVLFAHPLWELALDGALIRREGLATMLRTLEDAHRRIGGAEGRALAEHVGLTQLLPDAHARDAFDAKLESLWAALIEGPWLTAYTSPGGLAECIVRMRQRVGVSALMHKDRERLEQAIATLEPLADHALARRS